MLPHSLLVKGIDEVALQAGDPLLLKGVPGKLMCERLPPGVRALGPRSPCKAALAIGLVAGAAGFVRHLRRGWQTDRCADPTGRLEAATREGYWFPDEPFFLLPT